MHTVCGGNLFCSRSANVHAMCGGNLFCSRSAYVHAMWGGNLFCSRCVNVHAMWGGNLFCSSSANVYAVCSRNLHLNRTKCLPKLLCRLFVGRWCQLMHSVRSWIFHANHRFRKLHAVCCEYVQLCTGCRGTVHSVPDWQKQQCNRLYGVLGPATSHVPGRADLEREPLRVRGLWGGHVPAVRALLVGSLVLCWIGYARCGFMFSACVLNANARADSICECQWHEISRPSARCRLRVSTTRYCTMSQQFICRD